MDGVHMAGKAIYHKIGKSDINMMSIVKVLRKLELMNQHDAACYYGYLQKQMMRDRGWMVDYVPV